ncbi:oxygenase MpaB family protein [Glaciihabitans sp. dw_435]|uniref:oxygenase MpaB family protein n=1 Tax=Glaciihabitans sp. dw_435 TaxID=2720081 RepID=UPI001BD64DDE|nr:oxygenase MpaB family protein [Glaciihabitans sp. dw_435]
MRLRDMGSEAVLLGAGGRAILLQLGNPAVGHAVAEHSSFATDPTRRLRHTLTYVYALLWGTEGQARFVTAMVNRAHAPVVSEGGGATGGPAYTAVDPQLQLWVTATLYDSAIVMHERIFGALGPADAEAIYQDYAEIGVGLQMPRELWPRDIAAFRQYWDAAIDGLVVDDVTRGVARQLLWPRVGPVWLRAAMPLARWLTIGLLPSAVRHDFGLAWDDAKERRFERMMRAAAHIYPLLPNALRQWPKNHLLKKLPATAPASDPAR